MAVGYLTKYARGTVWMCEEDNLIEGGAIRKGFRTHVQKKTRPVLIVSSNFGNSHSPVVNVLPITSQSKSCSVNVEVFTEDKSVNYILCNQIKTVDAARLSYYMFSVDESVMLEVEKTIQTVLGIAQPRIAKSIEDLEKLINNISAAKFNELSNREEFDKIVENIAQGLEDNYKSLIENYIINLNSSAKRLSEQVPSLSTRIEPIKINNLNKSDSSSSEVNKPVNKNTGTNKTNRSTKPRGYWTEERKRQYVEDFNTHTIQWMMLTYEIDTEAQAKKRRNQYSYELNRDAKKRAK